MSNPINNLLFNAGGNLSRPANFSIEFVFPSKLNNQKSSTQYDILCKNISIPDTDTKKVDLSFKGSTIPIMTRVDYNRSLNITLLIDEKHEIMRDLITWQKGLDKNTLNPGTDIQTMFDRKEKRDILGSINLIVKDWQENNVAKYVFEDIYPLKVGSIEYDGSSVSGVLEIQVEFAFLVMRKEETFDAMNVGAAQQLVDVTIGALDTKITSIMGNLDTGLSNIFSDNIKKTTNLVNDKNKMIDNFSNLLNGN